MIVTVNPAQALEGSLLVINHNVRPVYPANQLGYLDSQNLPNVSQLPGLAADITPGNFDWGRFGFRAEYRHLHIGNAEGAPGAGDYSRLSSAAVGPVVHVELLDSKFFRAEFVAHGGLTYAELNVRKSGVTQFVDSGISWIGSGGLGLTVGPKTVYLYAEGGWAYNSTRGHAWTQNNAQGVENIDLSGPYVGIGIGSNFGSDGSSSSRATPSVPPPAEPQTEVSAPKSKPSVAPSATPSSAPTPVPAVTSPPEF